MGHPSNPASSLNATASRDELTNTVRIDVLGTLDQTTRPSLVDMIHDLRRTGIHSHINVNLSQAVLVESTGLARLREDLNAMEGTPGTATGGVSLALTGEERIPQPDDIARTGIPGSVDGPEDEFAAAFEAGLQGLTHQSSAAMPDRALEEYSDDELFAASDAVFSLLDDPATVGGSDLLGQYNDIGQEIVRRTPLSELLTPATLTPGSSRPAGI